MCTSECVSEATKMELKEKYLAVKKLLDEDNKNDPETEPYKSKYAAMELLKNMQNLLFNSIDNANQQNSEVSSMLAVLYLNQGIVAIETEECKVGEDFLNKCIEILNKNEIKPESIIPLISALMQLGTLWLKRDEVTKAEKYFEQAEKAYKDYKNLKDSNSIIVGMSSLFGVEDSEEEPPAILVEKLYTLTLSYLAQIYRSLDEFLKSAIYCHMTLRKQLEMDYFNSVEWALNAATLSQFFMDKGGFKQARHHLAAATYILGKYEDKLKEMSSEVQDVNESEVLASKWENFKHRSADVSRCWAKYGILLMSMSRDRLVSDKSSTEANEESLDDLKFDIIENDIGHIANTITDNNLLDFNDAKEVFLCAQKWLDDAKLYYCLENHASDYVQIIQDMSQLYKHLTFFEEDENREAKMHKRRIDLLEGVVKELNERYYLSACRQIWFELGETYSEILNIKLDHLKDSDERPAPQALTKINNLRKSAITNFTKFLDSLKESGTDKFSKDMIRPALCAYFHLGRLYYKFITPDKDVQLENVKKSLDAYSFMVNYCEKDPEAAKIMAVEISVCKDFIKLLPVKITKLMHEISNS